LDVGMLCRRATVSWPVISVKRGIGSSPVGMRLQGPMHLGGIGPSVVVI
jgi:hypothetical protein